MAVVKRRRAPRGSGELLREEILDATTDLLLETGNAKEVSIRSVSQRVGVTPPSIYLHFADKDALLDAVCGRYFEKLDEEMQRASSQSGRTQPSTIEVLRAQGLAYVRFATKNPELYRIAMMGESRPGSDVDMALNTSAFLHIRNTVEALMAEGVLPPDDSTVVALELWAVGHGLATMLISRPYLPWGDTEEFVDRVLRAVVVGEIVSGAIAPKTSPQDTVAQLKGLLDEQRRR